MKIPYIIIVLASAGYLLVSQCSSPSSSVGTDIYLDATYAAWHRAYPQVNISRDEWEHLRRYDMLPKYITPEVSK